MAPSHRIEHGSAREGGWRQAVGRLAGPARLAAQTAVAALGTFALFELTGLPQVGWAVISALFVIQPNVGGTIGTALGRIAATVLGTGLGLACVLALGTSVWAIALGLLLAMAGLGFVTGWRPDLRYSLVPAAFILLAPYGDVLEKAWHGAAAIGIGALIGTLSGLLVFPQPAHRAAERRLGVTLGHCGDLLAAAVAALLGARCEHEIAAASERIDRELWAAGPLVAQSRYPSRLHRHPAHPPPRELLRAIERLWHSLLLIARAGQGPLPDATRAELAPALQSFAETGGAYLGALGEALIGNARPPPPDPTSERVRALDAALDRLRQRGATRPLASAQAQRVFTLAFATEELGRNLAEVARLFSGPGGRA